MFKHFYIALLFFTLQGLTTIAQAEPGQVEIGIMFQAAFQSYAQVETKQDTIDSQSDTKAKSISYQYGNTDAETGQESIYFDAAEYAYSEAYTHQSYTHHEPHSGLMLLLAALAAAISWAISSALHMMVLLFGGLALFADFRTGISLAQTFALF